MQNYHVVSLNEAKLDPNAKFNDKIHHHKKSFSILNKNIHVKEIASWYLPGGTAISVDKNFRSHQKKKKKKWYRQYSIREMELDPTYREKRNTHKIYFCIKTL